MWYGYNRGYDVGLDFFLKLSIFSIFKHFDSLFEIPGIYEPKPGDREVPRSLEKTQMTPTGWLSKIIIYS